ncbi:manganese/zinc/iron transport system ATP- binding protein [Tamaricihabitans halophyticus]|uniref:Manganese/zinc/iron transport system ATP-binding protein n=1 Tax=Tamaricihabitans halophyticus TaxID=1262583 RepID=A0A4V2SUR6_9PSEU|nr:ABC transporter ATP-binding protein [Tamaricihabitans halophyticus]TCP55126.1 manganese/zinc/iron transport system ATP- binding protein [Tamaricihabitans halophyticus]
MSEQHQLALQLSNVEVSYGGRPVLREVSFDIPTGVLAAIVGPNGAGKSTALKATLGLVPLTNGDVRILGTTLRANRRRVAYVPQQDLVTKDFPITAIQVVEMGRYPHRGWFRRLGADDDAAVAEAVERTGIGALLDEPLDELSGGQRQRVFLARALAQRADLLVLDEPFTAVDTRTEEALVDLLAELCADGATVLAVHHDLRTVAERFDHAVLLAGTVLAAGEVSDVLTTEALARAYGLAPRHTEPARAAR